MICGRRTYVAEYDAKNAGSKAYVGLYGICVGSIISGACSITKL
jgi:hypothetical protein